MENKFNIGSKVRNILTGEVKKITGFKQTRMYAKISGKLTERKVNEYYLEDSWNTTPEELLDSIKDKKEAPQFVWRVNLDTGLRYFTNFER